jgi:hypothetical protein
MKNNNELFHQLRTLQPEWTEAECREADERSRRYIESA